MTDTKPAGTSTRLGEVFLTFLKLGLTSFGGPVAHLGYFREELVVRRKWVDETSYGELVALCQFLPGPASSQVGFALGLLRGGPLGAVAAWLAFTLPSAILLVLFAFGARSLEGPVAAGVLHGLKLVAVAIVAQAVLGMARALAPDRARAAIAVAAVLVVVLLGGSAGQIVAIIAGASCGLWACRAPVAGATAGLDFAVPKWVGCAAMLAFAMLLVGLPLLAGAGPGLRLFGAFYRAGSLVFGGGHVVLPLLETEVVRSGWVSEADFLAGYGATQAVPGPLFTFATYLGAVMGVPPSGLTGAAIATVALFLPGFLILVGTLPFWADLRSRSWMQAAMRGANAAVVGVLGAALYSLVWTSAVLNGRDFALAVTGFALLAVGKIPPWIVVGLMATGGVALSLLAPMGA